MHSLTVPNWAAAPESGGVRGRVLYQGEPVLGASVVISVPGYPARETNAAGFYELLALPAVGTQIEATATVGGDFLTSRPLDVVVPANDVVDFDIALLPPDETLRNVTVDGTLYVLDYDSDSPNEDDTFQVHEACPVDPFTPTWQVIWRESDAYSRCVDDEVVAYLRIDCYFQNEDNSVTVALVVGLYEGASCLTTDYDGELSDAFNLGTGNSGHSVFTVYNTNLQGSQPDDCCDYIDVDLTVVNRRRR